MRPYYRKRGITIYHADSRDVLPSLRAGSVDMIFTDPPYGHNNNNGDLIHRWKAEVRRPRQRLAVCEAALGRPTKVQAFARPISNDGPEANDIFRSSLAEWSRVLSPGCCCCCCCSGGGGPDPQFARWSLWVDEVFDFKQQVIWDKGPMGMGWHYRRSYEVVLVAQKPGAACRWYDTTHRVENVIRGIRKIIPRADEHPTPKPAALAAHFIGLHSKPGELVLDPFLGGGSTLVAARDMGRRAIGIDIDERWCEMSARRLDAKQGAVPERWLTNKESGSILGQVEASE